MKVLKFGGASVGSPERMHKVKELITKDPDPKMIVLSAVSGTTNTLVEIGRALSDGNKHLSASLAKELHQKYINFYKELLKSKEGRNKGESVIKEHFSFIHKFTDGTYTDALNRELLAQGELLSTKLFIACLEDAQVNAKLIPAFCFMCIDENKEPAVAYIKSKLNQQLDAHKGYQIYLTQGYVCINHVGEIDNLKRGGSDYTTSLIGAALSSEEIHIWTDIDGMRNNDPRVVDKTKPVTELSFDEAAELAYFGAKILHPATIWPAQKHNIPVRLLNTMNPSAKGTIIWDKAKSDGFKAVAAKDGITAIKIKSSRMLLAYGFLKQVFEVFEKYKTPVDMVTTSEVAVSLTVDAPVYLNEIKKDLEQYGTVNIDSKQTIICVVGNNIGERVGYVNKILQALQDLPLRMVSYGGSRHNISLLVESDLKEVVLQKLNKHIFNIRKSPDETRATSSN